MGTAGCPRCGAEARLTASEPRGYTDPVVVSLRCPKCRGRSFVGLTTVRSLARAKRMERLAERAGSLAPGPELDRLERAMDRLARGIAGEGAWQ